MELAWSYATGDAVLLLEGEVSRVIAIAHTTSMVASTAHFGGLIVQIFHTHVR